jgi:hypothetical protein
MVAGVLTGTPGAAATATCVSWTGTQPPNPGAFDNRLFGVAARSPCDTWAVGNYFNDDMENFGQTLIEHWNGSSWKHVPSPSPGGKSENNTLLGVAAISRTDAWAVGDYSTSGTTQALIEHWDGAAWQQVPSPSVSFPNILTGVAAVAATDVWAVGEYFNNADVAQTLIEHWDGAAWTRVPSPNPGGASIFATLNGVAAVSGTGAWAVGDYENSARVQRSLIERWNGTAWRQVPSPDPSSISNLLNGVSASSAASIWAVGERNSNSPSGVGRTFAIHCC